MSDPLTAELALVETGAALQRAVRRALVVPLLLAGVVDLGGAVAAVAIGRDHLFSYFGPAYLFVIVFGAWWYRRCAGRDGLLLPVWPWVAIIVPTLMLCATTSRLGFAYDLPLLSDAGPGLANAGAVVVTGLWLRSSLLATTGAMMAVAVVLAVVVSSGDRAVALWLVVCGLLLINASRASR